MVIHNLVIIQEIKVRHKMINWQIIELINKSCTQAYSNSNKLIKHKLQSLAFWYNFNNQHEIEALRNNFKNCMITFNKKKTEINALMLFYVASGKKNASKVCNWPDITWKLWNTMNTKLPNKNWALKEQWMIQDL